MEGALVKKVG